MIAHLNQWLAGRLSRKLFFALAASLTAISLAFLILFVGYYRNRLIAERATTSAELNGLLQVALENAMLKRDLEGLQDIVERLGQKKAVSGVMILNPRGEVRFASPAAQLSRRFDLASDKFCPGCDVMAGGSTAAAFVSDPKVGSVLRSVNPVANRKPCTKCHGDVATNPINGILVVDYDAAEIRRDALAMALALTGSGVMVLLAGTAAIGWVIRRSVLAPVHALKKASLDLSDGRFDVEVATGGRDELAELGQTFRVMSQRLSAQRTELAQREDFLQSMIDAVPDGIRVIEADFNVLKVNKAFCDQQGLRPDQVIGRPCYASSHGRTEPCAPTLVTCPLYELTRSRKPLTCRHTHKRDDGSELLVEVSAAPLDVIYQGKRKRCVVEAIRDLSIDIHHSQEQRLSEIGQLAAGVAHEIRNPLSSIHLSLQTMRHKAPGEIKQNFLERLTLMDDEVDRCIQVTDRLLKLSTPPAELPELVSLEEIIPEVVSLLSAEAERVNTDIQLDLNGSLRVITSDGDMRMLVLNLVQNAFHAMPGGGTLRISGRIQDDNILLQFEDTGVGIASNDLQRIFQPFWSRRADGVHGTGLGLPICREILRRHGGHITVSSKLGEYSSFVVTLPWAESTTEAA